MAAGSVTSVGTTSVRWPNCLPSFAASFRRSTRRPAKTTDQPLARSASADALPIPLPAPVVIATRAAAMGALPVFGENQQVERGERKEVREADVVELVHRVFPLVIAVGVGAIHRNDGAEAVIARRTRGRVENSLVGRTACDDDGVDPALAQQRCQRAADELVRAVGIDNELVSARLEPGPDIA